MSSEAILEQVGLGAKKNAKVSDLTLEDKKRLELSKALATKPELLLLDEVMGGLNPTEIKEIMELIGKIRRGGMTIIVVEHVMHAVMSLADRVCVLHHGEKIADGPPAECLQGQAGHRILPGGGVSYCFKLKGSASFTATSRL